MCSTARYTVTAALIFGYAPQTSRDKSTAGRVEIDSYERTRATAVDSYIGLCSEAMSTTIKPSTVALYVCDAFEQSELGRVYIISFHLYSKFI